MADTWIWSEGENRPRRLNETSVAASAGRKEDAGAATRLAPLTVESEEPRQRIPTSGPLKGDAVFALTTDRIVRQSDVGEGWLLNEGAGTVNRLGEAEWSRVMRRWGLGVAPILPDERVYRVELFHLAAVALTRLNSKGEAIHGSRIEAPDASMSAAEGMTLLDSSGAAIEVVSDGTMVKRARPAPRRWPPEPHLRAAVRAASRALYALRLDCGEADVAVASDGRISVRAVYPLPRDKRRQAERLSRFAAWHAANAERKDRRMLIGADPEYALLMPSGKVAQASRYFGFGVGGAAGADAMLVGRRLLYPVAELRPAPAESPAALAANLRRLLARAAVKVGDPGLRWVAGAMPVPGLALGGHIHVSGAALTSRLLRLLDSCAAYPLALVEDPAGRGRRPRYGVLGDFRLQPHGGFEYRTLPSWLVSPAAAKAAFALALLCAREAMAMPRVPAARERYAEAYYAGDRSELAGCLDEVAGVISATESYAGLARYIEPLFDAARRGRRWDETTDIREKWRIPL